MDHLFPGKSVLMDILPVTIIVFAPGKFVRAFPRPGGRGANLVSRAEAIRRAPPARHAAGDPHCRCRNALRKSAPPERVWHAVGDASESHAGNTWTRSSWQPIASPTRMPCDNKSGIRS